MSNIERDKLHPEMPTLNSSKKTLACDDSALPNANSTSLESAAATYTCTNQVLEISPEDELLQNLIQNLPQAMSHVQDYLQSSRPSGGRKQKLRKQQQVESGSKLFCVVCKIVLDVLDEKQGVREHCHSSSTPQDANVLARLQEILRKSSKLKDRFSNLCKLALEDLINEGPISKSDQCLHFLSRFNSENSLESFDHRKYFGLIVRLSEQPTSEDVQITGFQGAAQIGASSGIPVNKESVKNGSNAGVTFATVSGSDDYATSSSGTETVNKQTLSHVTTVETHGSCGVVNERQNVGRNNDENGDCYKFIHPLLQEFLAAFALSKLPSLDQIQFLAEHLSKLFKNGHTYWLQFFIGISFRKEDDGFNATKMMTSTLLNVICHYLDITNHPGYIPTILRCVHEAGETSIWRKIASNHDELLTLEMTLDEFKGVNNNSIIAMVTHCGIKQWMIETSPANVKVITESFMMQKNVTIIAKDDDCTKVKISPQYSVGRVPKTSLQVGGACGVHCHEHDLNNFLTQATREILSRVLQLYSKIKLKEGQESVSYVSFISCECFQNAVEDSVTFEPTLPIHFLKIPAPKKKKLSHITTQRAVDCDALHLETAHNGDTVEMVLLNKPYLRSVTLKLPLTSQEYCIRLSGDYNCSDCYSSPSSSDYGDIASQVQTYGLQQNETFCHSETALCMEPTMSQMVYPLIPELSKARALSHHPRTTRTPVLSRQNSPSELEQACESETQPGTKVQVLQASDEQSSPNSNILKSATHSTKVSQVDTKDENELTEAAGHGATSKVVDTQSGFKMQTVNTEMMKANTGHTTEHIQSSSSTLDQHSGKNGRNLNVPTTVNYSQVNRQMSNSQSTSPLHRESRIGGAVGGTVGGAVGGVVGGALACKTSPTQTGDQCRPFVALQSSSKRQEPYPPGTVLFTSLPRVFPTDQIQPLPDESQLIKRGGNGAIFAGTIMGMSLAIKKTHYRSKEFEILTKIRHRNIVPLLALILGHEIPSSRRRYQCFHIMPRLTGDCARMLTDKKDLTLKNLRLRHRHNPRLLGLVQSNVKYIIREVLRGLSYLHSLHIAHRDVKGGNILLKFFCSCDNPLECGCSSKYQVLLTDFDAAIELDSQNRLPPASSTHNHTHPPRYHCVPVGTNGYRAPECSMHVVTSTPEAFSPPISTKCDSWSVGVLTSRILVGYEGPYSQREMAVLVLRYHQIAGFVEGVSRFNIAHVDDYVLESVLQLSSPRREVEWMNHASSFMECSMELDPSKRHSTDQLLKHPFLH